MENLKLIRTEYVPAWRYLFRYLRKYGIVRAIRMIVIFARLRMFNPFGAVEVVIYREDVKQ
jgi:hypothetical protein